MRLIAIACCRLSGEGPAFELYPDADRDLLAEASQDVGFASVAVSWDDPEFDWSSVAGVLVRSTWDSVDRPEEYVRWARQVSTQTVLLNSTAVIEWNLNKSYLRDLAAAGIDVVPTEWVLPGETWVPILDQDFVIKPAISAGGRDTVWYSPGQTAHAEAHVAHLLELGHSVLVQPYLCSVQDPGEVDLIYLNGRYSHAARKGALLERDAGVQQRPWERMTWLGLAEPTDAEHALGNKVFADITSRLGVPAYGPVDLSHRKLAHRGSYLGRVWVSPSTVELPLLLAISDNGTEMKCRDTRRFMAVCSIAQHFGRPSTPTDQAWIETLWGHIKYEHPHLMSITDPAVLAAELERIRVHYNTVRLHEAIGYVTPDDEHNGRGDAIRAARTAGLRRADTRRRAWHRLHRSRP